ncbi:MAG: hypothetical protein WCD11_31055 [Solirubrobacteraceae bacterium]
MQIGAVYPQIELRGDPSAVRRLALAVEELGFDYLLAYDHAGLSTSSARSMSCVRRGPPGDLTAEIDAWRDAGGTHLSVVTMGLGLDAVDSHIDYLASVANALSLS